MSTTRSTILTAALLSLAAGSLAAQNPTGVAAVDSAAVARAANARARAALASDNVGVALAELARATTAWPGQPAYWWAQAVVSAVAHDTAGVLRSLNAYAAMGLGRDLSGSAELRGFTALPAFRAVVAAHAVNRSPNQRSRIRATLPDSTFWPEGLAYDATSGAIYVTSIRHRTIAEVGRDGRVRELLPRQQAGVGAILGIAVDPAGGKLWATTSGLPQMGGYNAPDSAIATLLLIDIATGAIEKRWDVPPDGRAKVLGEVAVGANGFIYITDSKNPTLYVFDPQREVFNTLASPLFRSLQGIATTPDPNVIYVADYSHGLLRTDLKSRSVVRVEDAAGTTSLGCDGLAWVSGALICVQNGVAPARIARFELSGDGASITAMRVLDRNPAVADEPTNGKVIGGHFVYVANSQWEKYEENGMLKANAVLARPTLLSVPID